MGQLIQRFLAGLGIGRTADGAVGAALPREPDPDLDPSPDRPQPFGFKVNWFAVRATDPASVLDALGLAARTPANWTSGMAAAYRWSSAEGSARWVFASPAVDGWVFLVGGSLPYPIDTEDGDHDGIGRAFDAVFGRLKHRFDEVQFFGSYRVSSFAAWARAARGTPERVFSYGDGSVYANLGDQTPEEAALGFPRLDGLPVSEATDRMFELSDEQSARQDALVASGLPVREAMVQALEGKACAIPGEDDVVAIAGLWSLDPSQLGDPARELQTGVGLVARLPEELMRLPG